MKIICNLSLFSLCISIGCNSYVANHQNEQTLRLDSIGQLKIILPFEFDTNYTSIARNDYPCGTTKIFYSQAKQYPSVPQFHYMSIHNPPEPDSLYYFSISYAFDRICDSLNSNHNLDSIRIYNNKLAVELDGNNSSHILKLLNINGVKYLSPNSIYDSSSQNMKYESSASRFLNNTYTEFKLIKKGPRIESKAFLDSEFVQILQSISFQ